MSDELRSVIEDLKREFSNVPEEALFRIGALIHAEVEDDARDRIDAFLNNRSKGNENGKPRINTHLDVGNEQDLFDAFTMACVGTLPPQPEEELEDDGSYIDASSASSFTPSEMDDEQWFKDLCDSDLWEDTLPIDADSNVCEVDDKLIRDPTQEFVLVQAAMAFTDPQSIESTAIDAQAVADSIRAKACRELRFLPKGSYHMPFKIGVREILALGFCESFRDYKGMAVITNMPSYNRSLAEYVNFILSSYKSTLYSYVNSARDFCTAHVYRVVNWSVFNSWSSYYSGLIHDREYTLVLDKMKQVAENKFTDWIKQYHHVCVTKCIDGLAEYTPEKEWRKIGEDKPTYIVKLGKNKDKSVMKVLTFILGKTMLAVTEDQATGNRESVVAHPTGEEIVVGDLGTIDCPFGLPVVKIYTPRCDSYEIDISGLTVNNTVRIERMFNRKSEKCNPFGPINGESCVCRTLQQDEGELSAELREVISQVDYSEGTEHFL